MVTVPRALLTDGLQLIRYLRQDEEVAALLASVSAGYS